MIEGFYINLRGSEERKNAIQACINEASPNFNISRFNGIYGSDASISNPHLTHGQWGCYLSHTLLIQNNLNSQNHLLIIEDDSHFNKSINLISEKIEKLDDSWDIIYLDATLVEIEDQLLFSRKIIEEKNKSKDILNIEKIPSTATIYGTHCYLINKSSINKIHKILLNNAMTGLPIDNVLSAAIQEGKITAHITLPFLTAPSEASMISTINTSEHPLLRGWIELRHSMSIHESNANKLINVIKKNILDRLEFNFLEKFQPYAGKISKLI